MITTYPVGWLGRKAAYLSVAPGLACCFVDQVDPRSLKSFSIGLAIALWLWLLISKAFIITVAQFLLIHYNTSNFDEASIKL